MICNPPLLGWNFHNRSFHGWKEGILILARDTEVAVVVVQNQVMWLMPVNYGSERWGFRKREVLCALNMTQVLFPFIWSTCCMVYYYLWIWVVHIIYLTCLWWFDCLNQMWHEWLSLGQNTKVYCYWGKDQIIILHALFMLPCQCNDKFWSIFCPWVGSSLLQIFFLLSHSFLASWAFYFW
jgi:hypothetical protein